MRRLIVSVIAFIVALTLIIEKIVYLIKVISYNLSTTRIYDSKRYNIFSEILYFILFYILLRKNIERDYIKSLI